MTCIRCGRDVPHRRRDFICDPSRKELGRPAQRTTSQPQGNPCRPPGPPGWVHPSRRLACPSTAAFVHCGHDNQKRPIGNSVLPRGVDTLIHFEKEDDVVTLECTKQKNAARFKPIRLRLDPSAVYRSGFIGQVGGLIRPPSS